MNKTIGIIGTGKIGKAIAQLLVKAGYNIMLTSKNGMSAKKLAVQLGKSAIFRDSKEIVASADIVILSIPFGEIPVLAQSLLNVWNGKILLDTSNPKESRDGELAKIVLESDKSSGVWVASYFPGAKVVKAFSTIDDKILAQQIYLNHPSNIAIPLASDYKEPLDEVCQLVADMGFQPVVVGNLQKAKEFGPGTMPYGANVTKEKLQKYFDIFGVD